jgi:hypothetical protein
MPKLARSLNHLVTVANPAFFGDDAPRRLILVDIEEAGLWFSGEALNETLSEHALASPPEGAMASIFFPFEQIAYLLDPRQFAQPARALHAPVSPADLEQRLPPAARASARPSGRRRATKNPKSTR